MNKNIVFLTLFVLLATSVLADWDSYGGDADLKNNIQHQEGITGNGVNFSFKETILSGYNGQLISADHNNDGTITGALISGTTLKYYNMSDQTQIASTSAGTLKGSLQRVVDPSGEDFWIAGLFEGTTNLTFKIFNASEDGISLILEKDSGSPIADSDAGITCGDLYGTGFCTGRSLDSGSYFNILHLDFSYNFTESYTYIGQITSGSAGVCGTPIQTWSANSDVTGGEPYNPQGIIIDSEDDGDLDVMYTFASQDVGTGCHNYVVYNIYDNSISTSALIGGGTTSFIGRVSNPIKVTFGFDNYIAYIGSAIPRLFILNEDLTSQATIAIGSSIEDSLHTEPFYTECVHDDGGLAIIRPSIAVGTDEGIYFWDSQGDDYLMTVTPALPVTKQGYTFASGNFRNLDETEILAYTSTSPYNYSLIGCDYTRTESYGLHIQSNIHSESVFAYPSIDDYDSDGELDLAFMTSSGIDIYYNDYVYTGGGEGEGEAENETTSAITGSEIYLPSSLVDVEGGNLDEGLLPEIYTGMRVFFSKIIIPLIYIVTIVMILMLVVLLTNVIKKATQ